MKSNYYLQYYYCGIAIMHEPEVGRYFRNMLIEDKAKVLRYNGKKIESGYLLLPCYLYEQPYYKSYEGVKLADEK